MKTEKISLLEYNSLIWFIVRAGCVGLTISNLIMISKQDCWLSGLLALILSIIPLFIFYKLRSYDKDKNICELNEYAFGKIGKIINIFLALGALFFTFVAFLEITYFVNSQFLYKTEYIYISICFIIPIIYALFKGINAITKTSLILFYIIILTALFIVIGVSSGINIENLKPAFQTPPSNLLHGALIIITYNVLPLLFLLIIKQSQIKNNKTISSVIFFVISLLTLVNVAFLTIGAFGVNMSILYEYPEFQILKKVEIGEFVNRLESILSLEWIISLFVLIIMGLLFVTENIKQTFKLKEKTNKIVILIVCLILLIASHITFTSNLINHDFLKTEMIIIMFIIFLGVPALTLLKLELKRLHNQNRA